MRVLVLFSIFFFGLSSAFAVDRCKDAQLLSGEEPIISYGLDTTQHWWAITQPFSSRFRLIVDNQRSEVFLEIHPPVFSPDGENWAAFALNNTGQWMLLQRDTILTLNCNTVGDIYFGQSGALAYTYTQGANELFSFNGKEYRTVDRTSEIFISCDGYRFVYSAVRGNGETLVTSEGESEIYDDVRPVGIWTDGKPVFIARYGQQWKLYKGKEPLSRAFDIISSVVMNFSCNVVAIAGSTGSGAMVQLYSDEYYDPLESRVYDAISDLVVHPTQPMYACVAQFGTALSVVFNGVEYDAGRDCGKPWFTHDGAELMFVGVDQQYFLTVNGKRYIQPAAIDLSRKYAAKPRSNTYAFGSSAGLVVRETEKNMTYSGTMVDETTPPRYNWRINRYEALGRINQRLFLLTCQW